MRPLARSFGLLAAFASLLAASRASAWCRTTTNLDFVPTEQQPCDTSGTPIAWPTRCTSFHVLADDPAAVDGATLAKETAAAFTHWSSVSCPADVMACDGDPQGSPSITVSDGGDTHCTPGYVSGGPNLNVVTVRPHGLQSPEQLALTTVSFRTSDGTILRADLEVAGSFPLAAGDPTPDQYDLQSILQHETGHFLGLAHSDASGATMSPRYSPGDTFMRTLAQDDVCGVCAAAPPSRDVSCTPEQTPTCTALAAPNPVNAQPMGGGGGGCSYGRTSGGAWVVALAMAALLGARRRS